MKANFFRYACSVALLAGCADLDPSFYSNVLRSDVFIQKGNDSKYDFLMVVDNSQSMAPIRQLMKDNMNSFVSTLNSRKAIDYQIAIVTTDYFAQSGDLIKTGTGPSDIEVVKSATSADPIRDFGRLMDAVVDTDSSFWEQGLESAYQGLKKHASKFSRPGVPLVIMIVTDEDDYSCDTDCFGPRPEINTNAKFFGVQRYVDYFSGFKAAENTDTYVFPITGLNMDQCPVASAGLKYMDVSTQIGGLSKNLSICADAMADSYGSVAQIIADRGMKFPLSAVSSGAGFALWVNGQSIPFTPDNYIYDVATNSIVFTGFVPKKGSTIEVTYSQQDK